MDAIHSKQAGRRFEDSLRISCNKYQGSGSLARSGMQARFWLLQIRQASADLRRNGELQELYDQYSQQGLQVLGFPCNQFGGREPGTSEEAESFCQLNYGVNFPIFAKIDVNGEDTHPLFQYLKSGARTERRRRDRLEFHKVSGRPRGARWFSDSNREIRRNR